MTDVFLKNNWILSPFIFLWETRQEAVFFLLLMLLSERPWALQYHFILIVFFRQNNSYISSIPLYLSTNKVSKHIVIKKKIIKSHSFYVPQIA